MAGKLTSKNGTPSEAPTTPHETKSQIPTYARISLITFLCFGGVLIGLIANADKLSRYGLLQPVYYLVLLTMGLTAAGFLFGVLHTSSATWAGKVWGGTLRLGGPPVVVALVVIGGHYFIPMPTFFPLTIYVHGKGGAQDIVLRNTGKVFLKLGPEISSELIGENGQAIFPRIPPDLRGQQAPAWVESDDYEAAGNTVTLAGSDVDLIVKKKIKHFELAGIVSDKDGRPLPGVSVALPDYDLHSTTQSDGRFEFDVTADHEQMVNLTAAKLGYQTASLRPTLGDLGVNFPLKEDR
jgi:hypothetical protein